VLTLLHGTLFFSANPLSYVIVSSVQLGKIEAIVPSSSPLFSKVATLSRQPFLFQYPSVRNPWFPPLSGTGALTCSSWTIERFDIQGRYSKFFPNIFFFPKPMIAAFSTLTRDKVLGTQSSDAILPPGCVDAL